MHWKRDEHGLIIYSVGANGNDDGGIWPRGNPYSYNKDEGFRLDDPRTARHRLAFEALIEAR